jgi:hypothetical protein
MVLISPKDRKESPRFAWIESEYLGFASANHRIFLIFACYFFPSLRNCLVVLLFSTASTFSTIHPSIIIMASYLSNKSYLLKRGGAPQRQRYLSADRKSSVEDSLSAFLGGSDSDDGSWSGLELDVPLLGDFGSRVSAERQTLSSSSNSSDFDLSEDGDGSTLGQVGLEDYHSRSNLSCKGKANISKGSSKSSSKISRQRIRPLTIKSTSERHRHHPTTQAP